MWYCLLEMLVVVSVLNESIRLLLDFAITYSELWLPLEPTLKVSR